MTGLSQHTPLSSGLTPSRAVKLSGQYLRWLLLMVLLGLAVWFYFWFLQKNVEDAKSQSSNSKGDATATVAPAKQAASYRLTITVEEATLQQLVNQLSANGTVQAWQEASIGAASGGLRIENVLVNVGDTVRKGQVLATMDHQGVAAQWAQAKAQFELASADARRAKSIAHSDALSKQQLDQYLTQEKVARAQLNGARERIANAVVRASDAGIISARNASVGAVPAQGQELFRLIRAGRLEWRAELTPEAAGGITLGTAVKIQSPQRHTGQFINGKVRAIAPIADSQTRNITVYVDLPIGIQNKGWRGGLYANGEFEQGQRSAITLPQQAVVVRDGFYYAFVLQSDGRVQERKLQTGARDAGRVEILDGVRAGERVAVQGAGFLHDQDLVRLAQ